MSVYFCLFVFFSNRIGFFPLLRSKQNQFGQKTLFIRIVVAVVTQAKFCDLDKSTSIFVRYQLRQSNPFESFQIQKIFDKKNIHLHLFFYSTRLLNKQTMKTSQKLCLRRKRIDSLITFGNLRTYQNTTNRIYWLFFCLFVSPSFVHHWVWWVTSFYCPSKSKIFECAAVCQCEREPIISLFNNSISSDWMQSRMN